MFNVRPRKTHRPAPLPAPAERAMEDRNQLYRQYRRDVLADREQLFQSSQDGERLREFATAVKRYGPDLEPHLINLIKHHSWLRNASETIRIEALRIINERCMQNRIRQNKHPLNDPMPGEPDDVYRICKRELGL